MQPLARDGLSAARVRDLLLADDLSVSAGCELLRSDLSVREDISDDLVGGSISWDLHNDIHRICTLFLTRRLRWDVDLVRPYMVVSDGDVSARFHMGVFTLPTPLSVFGEDPQTFEVRGYDRLRLLNRQVGADYTVAAGTVYRTALLNVFAAAGLSGVLIEGSAADNTLPKTRVWRLVGDDQADPDQSSTPATWLRIVNDLLRAINFRAVWVDERGTFRCEAYRDPGVRPSEFTFDADDVRKGIVGEDRSLDEDMFDVPNRWVFRQTNRPDGAPAPTEGDGIYTYPSTGRLEDGRDLPWTSVLDYEAASQAVLVSLGDARVKSDLRRSVKFSLTTGPFPAAGHADVFTYRDSAAGGEFKVQAVSWALDLDGSDMQWTWEAV